jgi:hypothetical protein
MIGTENDRLPLFPWEIRQDPRPIVVPGRGEPMDLRLSQLNVDYTYQALAPRNPKLVKEISKNPDMTLLGRLMVVQRADGSYFVVDGRHRMEGIKAANIGDVMMPCDVYQVHDRKREIEIFVQRNTRLRKVPQTMLFMAEVAAGDAEAVELNRLVQTSGLAIVDENNKREEFAVPKLACIGALKSLYGHGSPSYAKRATAVPHGELQDALEIISELAPPNATVTEHAALGFVWLVHNFPEVRQHGKRLHDIGWQRIDAAARSVGPRPKAEDAGKALLSVIDFRRPSPSRLAPGLDLQPPAGLPPMAKQAA